MTVLVETVVTMKIYFLYYRLINQWSVFPINLVRKQLGVAIFGMAITEDA